MSTERKDFLRTRDQASVEPLSGVERESSADLLDYLILFAKNKGIILKVTLACAAASIVIALLIPNTYQSETKLLPPQQNQSVANMMLGQLAPLAALAGKDLGIKNPSDLYVGMLQSDSVADELVKRFDLRGVYKSRYQVQARKKLRGNTDISSSKEGVISVAVEDRSPERARDLAKGYVEELQKLTSRLAVTEAGQRRLFYEQQLKIAKDNLADAEVKLKATSEKTGLIDAKTQAEAMIGAVARVRAQIAAHEVQLQAMRSFATEQNPDYIRVQQELAGLRTQLAKLEKTSTGGDGDIQVATSKIPTVGLEYVRAYRDVKYYETIYELIAKQYEIARLDESKESSVIQVIDEAQVPERKYGPPRAIIVILSTFLGFCFVSLFVITRESVRQKNTDPGWSVRYQIFKNYFSRR